MLAASPQAAGEAVAQRLAFDGATVHADWATRDDVDTAVFAGSMRMLSQRRLPSSRPGQSLVEAWQTKQEVDAFIDARSREGRRPGRRAHALFRAFSARLALARTDRPSAVGEAEWAMILADRGPVRGLAQGLHTLSTSLLGEAVPTFARGVAPDRVHGSLGVRGLAGMGEAYEILAAAHHAVRALDRGRYDQLLPLVGQDAAAIGGVWAVRAAAEAFGAALWGDPVDALERLFALIARDAIMGREHEEPLGVALIARARLLLLTKAGAFGAAAQLADTLPARVRLLPLARMHLWAGQWELARELARAGRFEDDLVLSDRPKLALVSVGAALLEGERDPRLRTDAARAIRDLFAEENLLPVATLPKPAREAVVELCRDELADEPLFEVMVERLGALNDAGETGVRPVRLTEREKVLLPLLASNASVPQIARRLQVSVNTVRKQVVTLREKFGADTRAELVRRARTRGALD